MSRVSLIVSSLIRCLTAARAETAPYRYWLMQRVLPLKVAFAIACLPIAPAEIGETLGRRDSHNESRLFLAADMQRRFSICHDVAEAFQDPSTVAMIEKITDAKLEGAFLRIEFCQDTQGFWLAPHRDIGAKLFTLQIFLSPTPKARAWGTDILNADGTLFTTLAADFDAGFMFVPGPDTWHGFHPRPIAGIRKSLIVNYVKPEWRSRHELAFPDRPVTGGRRQA